MQTISNIEENDPVFKEFKARCILEWAESNAYWQADWPYFKRDEVEWALTYRMERVLIGQWDLLPEISVAYETSN